MYLMHIRVIKVYDITIFTWAKHIDAVGAWTAGWPSEIVLLSQQNVTRVASLGNRDGLDNMSGSAPDSMNPG